MHFRLQDYQATPLIDCGAFHGAENFTHDNLTCVVGGRVVGMVDAVAASAEVPLPPPRPLPYADMEWAMGGAPLGCYVFYEMMAVN